MGEKGTNLRSRDDISDQVIVVRWMIRHTFVDAFTKIHRCITCIANWKLKTTGNDFLAVRRFFLTDVAFLIFKDVFCWLLRRKKIYRQNFSTRWRGFAFWFWRCVFYGVMPKIKLKQRKNTHFLLLNNMAEKEDTQHPYCYIKTIVLHSTLYKAETSKPIQDLSPAQSAKKQ